MCVCEGHVSVDSGVSLSLYCVLMFFELFLYLFIYSVIIAVTYVEVLAERGHQYLQQ